MDEDESWGHWMPQPKSEPQSEDPESKETKIEVEIEVASDDCDDEEAYARAAAYAAVHPVHHFQQYDAADDGLSSQPQPHQQLMAEGCDDCQQQPVRDMKKVNRIHQKKRPGPVGPVYRDLVMRLHPLDPYKSCCKNFQEYQKVVKADMDRRCQIQILARAYKQLWQSKKRVPIWQ